MLFILRFFAIVALLVFSTAVGVVLVIVRPRHADNVYVLARTLGFFGRRILGIERGFHGLTHLQNLGPAVFISNHQNNIDVFTAGELYPHRTVTLGKRSVILVPFFGQFFWLSGNILIDRNNREKSLKTMDRVKRILKGRGISIWIMPEGHRSRGRGLLPFKKGAFHTAIAAGVPVVPICFSTYHGKLDFNKWKSGPIVSEVLAPIPTAGLTVAEVDELRDRCHGLMEQTIQRLDQEVEKLAGQLTSVSSG